MKDIDAFVFNIHSKYTPSNHNHAIYTETNGFEFGDWILRVRGDELNTDNGGGCCTGEERGYAIEGDVSPLTNQYYYFTCS